MAGLLYARMSAILRAPRWPLPRRVSQLAALVALVAFGAVTASVHLPVAAQALATAPAAAATSAPSAAALAAALRSGGYIVYFRHTATDFSQNDEKMRDFDDCANQRNLTDAGREQAQKIGAVWRTLNIPVGRVLASPYCRTREVAQLAFGRYERAMDVRGGPGSTGDPVRYQPLSRLLATPPKPGTNDVISSHGNPFRALHPGLPYLSEGEAAVIRPLPPDGHEVLGRIAWDRWPAP